MKCTHVIFDFDGVLADTGDVNFAISKGLHPEITNEDFAAHHDGNVYESPRIPFNEDTKRQYFVEYKNQLSESHLAAALSPVRELALSHQLYIVSSTSEDPIRSVLKSAGIESLFVRVMGYETHSSKVEKFGMLMREHGVTPENSIFVTDTLGDVKEAKKVGIRAIAETFGFHDRSRLAQGEPYTIVDTWAEILQEIEKLDAEA